MTALFVAIAAMVSASSPAKDVFFFVSHTPDQATQIFLSCRGGESEFGICELTRVDVSKEGGDRCVVRTRETRAPVAFEKSAPNTWVRFHPGTLCAHLADTWTLHVDAKGVWRLTYAVVKLREAGSALERECGKPGTRMVMIDRGATPTAFEMNCRFIVMAP
jgi:hypothetical protein